MTALDTTPAIVWVDVDIRSLAATIAHAHRDDTLDMLARRALALAAQHPDRAADVVRAIDAALTVRTAELRDLAAAQSSAVVQVLLAQAATHRAERADTEATNLRPDLDAVRATVEFDHVGDQPVDQFGRLRSALHEQSSLREEHPDERGEVGGVSDQHVISQAGVEHLEAALELDGADLLSVGPFLGCLDELRGATHNDSPSLVVSGDPSVGAGLVGEVPPDSPTGHTSTGQVTS